MTSNTTRLRDLLIFLPGIMGSSLQLDGKDIWAVSGQALWQYLKTFPRFGRTLHSLGVRDDDFERADLGDGVTAGEVVMGDVLVAPLVRIGGYRPIIERIPQEFAGVVQGSVHAPRDDANFFPFPYDWRRDNRATALKLKAFIDQQLPRWRQHSGAKDAQVILIAHSMGGLIARFYLELLAGWRDCRALITVATPHRGALNAVDTLANGIARYPALNAVVRELTSIYQLLPIYEAVLVDGMPARVAEIDTLPGIDRERAIVAREKLHLAIIDQATKNRAAGISQLTIPWVGIYQDTFQSALLEQGNVTMSYGLPPIVDAAFVGGDGTVPRVSAVPADFSKADEERLPRYSAQQHGWLTNNEMTLTPLVETVRGILAPGTGPVLGGLQGAKPAISLRADAVFGPGEPVALHLALGQTTSPLTLEARLEPVAADAATLRNQVRVAPGEQATLRFEGVSPGLYRVTVRARGGLANPPEPVQSLIEVVDAAAIEAVHSVA